MILDMCRGLARARPYVKQCHRLQGKNLNRVVTMLLEEKCTFREKRDNHYISTRIFTLNLGGYIFYFYFKMFSSSAKLLILCQVKGLVWVRVYGHHERDMVMVKMGHTVRPGRRSSDARFQPRNAITSTLRSMTGNRNDHAQDLETLLPITQSPDL